MRNRKIGYFVVVLWVLIILGACAKKDDSATSGSTTFYGAGS